MYTGDNGEVVIAGIRYMAPTAAWYPDWKMSQNSEPPYTDIEYVYSKTYEAPELSSYGFLFFGLVTVFHLQSNALHFPPFALHCMKRGASFLIWLS